MAIQGTYYLDAPSLSTATVIYSNASLTVVAPDGFYADGLIVREQASGVLLPQSTCPSCSNEFLIGFGAAQEDACLFISSATVTGDDTVFCDCTTFTGGVFAAAATGTWYVSYGGNYVPVSVTNGNPVATVTGACSACASLVRLDWAVGAQSGGRLIVYDSSMTELLNITSSSGGAQGGTLYIPTAQTPYTVRGEWASGSGNVIQYNVCDAIDGILIYSSGLINSLVGFEDYYASPTLVHAIVQLTANSVPPPTCPIP